MATLEEILKKLNKDKKEEDIISILGDKKIERGLISTGSPYINYLLGGGYLDGGYNTIIADGGSGKSSLALLACADVINNRGKYAVYFDGEGTLNDSYIDRMGVDRSKFIWKKGRNLETMLDDAEAFSTADDVGIIILDSIPIFTSTTVEMKSASDQTMAVEARKYNQRMPVIEGNCMNRNICIIGLTSYKLDPGAMGDPRKLPRGQWQFTMANVMLELTRKDFILDKDKNPIGHKLDVRIKKSKNASYNPKEAYTVDFFYNGGFNIESEYARLFVEKNIIKQGGAWYKFPSPNGEELNLQGIDSVITYLKNDNETFNFLKQLL